MIQSAHAPVITYHLPDLEHPIGTDDPIWSSFIPTGRDHFTGHHPKHTDASIRYGDYFKGIQDVIKQNGFQAIIDAGACQIDQPITVGDLKEVRICLEKHGEYYHPARLEIFTHQDHYTLVANVAFSNSGQATLKYDYMNMIRLTQEYPYSFLPAVYHLGKIDLGKTHRTPYICLGQWLERYNEFHLTRRSDETTDYLIVWDAQRGNHYLSSDQRQEVYRQAALILTAYYNLETTEHISAWHHAAGDFVVADDETSGQIDLKLITVRKYAPLIQEIPRGAAAAFQALLLFLLNMTIRMRIDRLDGVAEMAWADDHALEGTLAGFFQGLALQVHHDIIPEDVPVYFKEYLSKLSAEDALDLLASMVARMPSDSPELSLVETHLQNHAAGVYRTIRELSNPR